jgi:hypothetical protein
MTVVYIWEQKLLLSMLNSFFLFGATMSISEQLIGFELCRLSNELPPKKLYHQNSMFYIIYIAFVTKNYIWKVQKSLHKTRNIQHSYLGITLKLNWLPRLPSGNLKVCVVWTIQLLCHSQLELRWSWAVTTRPSEMESTSGWCQINVYKLKVWGAKNILRKVSCNQDISILYFWYLKGTPSTINRIHILNIMNILITKKLGHPVWGEAG